jgi:hypothetical protein
MKRKFIILLSVIFLISLVGAVSINNPNLPLVQEIITGGTSTGNYTNVSNNSYFLNRHPDTFFYFASNPNAYISDGNTGWDNIYGFITNESDPLSWHGDNPSETRNFTTSGAVKGEIGNFTELYTANSTLHIGEVTLSSTNDTLEIEQGVTLNVTSYVGEGSRITNLSLTDSNLTNVSINGGNITANFFGTYDWTAEFPWLNFNSTYLYFNTTALDEFVNQTIVNSNLCYSNGTGCLSVINGTDGINGTNGIDGINGTNGINGINGTDGTNITLSYYEINLVITGNGTNTSLQKSMLITEIIVTPSNLATDYRFELKTGSGSMVDRNRINHTGIWDIEKNLAFNDTLIANITDASSSDTFDIKIKYLDNFKP